MISAGTSNPVDHNGPVSAEEFAERLWNELARDCITIERNVVAFGRTKFIELATSTIYDAMIETCGQGIKQ